MAGNEGGAASLESDQTAGGYPALFVFHDEHGRKLLPHPLSRYVPLHVAVREPLFHRLGTSWEAFEGLRFCVAGMPPVSFRGDDLRAGDGPLPCPPVHVRGCPGGAFAAGLVASILGCPMHVPLGKHLPAPPLSASTCPVTVSLIGQPLQGPPHDVVIHAPHLLPPVHQFTPHTVPSVHELKRVAFDRSIIWQEDQSRVKGQGRTMEETEAVRAGPTLTVINSITLQLVRGRFFLHRTVSTWDDGRLGLLRGEKKEGEEAGRTPPAVTIMCEPIELEAQERRPGHPFEGYARQITRVRKEAAAAFAEWQAEARRGRWEVEVEWIRLFKERPPPRPTSSSSSGSSSQAGSPLPSVWSAHELLPLLMVARRQALPSSLTHTIASYLTASEASWLRGRRLEGRTRITTDPGQDCPPPPPDRDYEFYQQYFRQHRRQPRITMVFEPSAAVPRGALLRVHAPMLNRMALPDGCWSPCVMGGKNGEHATWYVIAGEAAVQRRDYIGRC